VRLSGLASAAAAGAVLGLLAGCASAPVSAPLSTRLSTPPGERLERRVMVMGTSLELAVEAASREQALAASEGAVRALEAAEARLSTWRDDTELARLNRAAVGDPYEMSPALAADLAGARRCWEETGGAFDPAIGALIKAWDLRGAGRVPSADERREAVAAGGMAGLRLGPSPVAGVAGIAVRERPGLVLEEGGFGKGAGLADALAVLAESPGVTGALLDLGGQVAVFGASRGADRAKAAGWTVEMADPRRRGRPVLALTIPGGSVSTSGNSERGLVVGGERFGHILDPRTGGPAPDFGSLTVWAADPLAADCLSTGLYVMGPDAALGWAVAHPGIEVLVLRPEGDRLEVLASAGWKGRIEPLVPEVEIEYRS
jgi:thiamine biosynthesis lipoprotein